jgi:uncharacterized coiled-coil protein SlyX
MSAEHVEPDPRAALEARVAKLEEAVHHQLPGKVDAVGWAVGLLHHDLRALREQTSARFDQVDARLDRVELHLGRQDDRMDAIDGRLDRHGEMLEEILRRLPDTHGEDSATTR